MPPVFRFEPPPPATSATRRLRWLILLTALATIVVDVVNLEFSPELGFGLGVRTVWAVLRALGFLFLMREVRFGRMGARPFGLILCVTTVFAVARLVQPREHGFLPAWETLAGLAALIVLCGLIMLMLYRSPAIEAHLTRRPPRRRIPLWVLTARVSALTFSPLFMVPCVVSIGTVFGTPRIDRAEAASLVLAWFVLAFVLAFAAALISYAVMFGKRWARVLLAVLAVFVLVAQPVLVALLLGLDGFIRDGVPLIITAILCLYGLWRSRSDPGGPHPARTAAQPASGRA
jgi:hypothetical protein